jgi:hypothetical protein
MSFDDQQQGGAPAAGGNPAGGNIPEINLQWKFFFV